MLQPCTRRVQLTTSVAEPVRACCPAQGRLPPGSAPQVRVLLSWRPSPSHPASCLLAAHTVHQTASQPCSQRRCQAGLLPGCAHLHKLTVCAPALLAREASAWACAPQAPLVSFDSGPLGALNPPPLVCDSGNASLVDLDWRGCLPSAELPRPCQVGFAEGRGCTAFLMPLLLAAAAPGRVLQTQLGPGCDSQNLLRPVQMADVLQAKAWCASRLAGCTAEAVHHARAGAVRHAGPSAHRPGRPPCARGQPGGGRHPQPAHAGRAAAQHH